MRLSGFHDRKSLADAIIVVVFHPTDRGSTDTTYIISMSFLRSIETLPHNAALRDGSSRFALAIRVVVARYLTFRIVSRI